LWDREIVLLFNTLPLATVASNGARAIRQATSSIQKISKDSAARAQSGSMCKYGKDSAARAQSSSM